MKININISSVSLFFIATSTLTTNCGSNIKDKRNYEININNLSLNSNVESEISNQYFSTIKYCGDSLFLSLKQKTNSPVTLLNTMENKTLKTYVLGNYQSTKLGNCILGEDSWPDSVSYIGTSQNNSNFDIALLSQKNVQFIESKTVKNKRLIKGIDSIIQSNKRIKDTIMPREIYCYKINNKKLESFNLNDKIYYIYSYTNESKYGSTKLLKFIIYNNAISLISLACSNNSIIFTLNNSQLFIGQWEAQCCTDQERYLMLYELKENGSVLKHNGDYWKDSENNMEHEINLQIGE